MEKSFYYLNNDKSYEYDFNFITDTYCATYFREYGSASFWDYLGLRIENENVTLLERYTNKNLINEVLSPDAKNFLLKMVKMKAFW